MKIHIKTKQEIDIMRTGGHILAEILTRLAKEVRPGISTGDLDEMANELCEKYNVLPAFKGYQGYSANICTGIDDVAVHGVPSHKEIIKLGQIISIDMGVIYKDFYTDSAVTVAVGEVDSSARSLIETTKLALTKAIDIAVEGNTVGDIGHTIESIATLAGFNVITQMTGHGVGRKLHEQPFIPCFGDAHSGEILRSGMTIAIEPMINEGESEIYVEENEWTTRTIDGKRSAIFEHTIVVQKRKSEILTPWVV